MLHPITLSIPEEKIVSGIIIKTQILSTIIPGCHHTYIFNTEKEYYEEYRKSYFALTKRKGGWDCLRHYEIIANGCIPYFDEIENCPENTLALLPKQLFIEGKELFHRIFLNKKIEEITQENKIEYENLLNCFIKNMKENLTTKQMARYILEKTNHKNISKVLYLSEEIYPDYLRCLTLHGFKQLLGKNCHDFPKILHLYQSDTIDYNKLYGKGMTYTNLLHSSLHNEMLDYTIKQDIEKRYYDIIIYGSYYRSMPYYELVSSNYEPDKVILLCGEDDKIDNYDKWINKGHYIFIREL